MKIISSFRKTDASTLRLEGFYLKVQMSTGKNVGRKRERRVGEGKHRKGVLITQQAKHFRSPFEYPEEQFNSLSIFRKKNIFFNFF